MVDQQKTWGDNCTIKGDVDKNIFEASTMLPGLIRPVARDGGGVLTFGLVAPFAGIMGTSHLTIGGPWKLKIYSSGNTSGSRNR